MEVFHVSEQYPHVATGIYTVADASRFDLGVRRIGADPLEVEVAEADALPVLDD